MLCECWLTTHPWPLSHPPPPDRVMAASSWKEQEMLDERIAELEGAKAALTSELAGARSELAAAQQSLAGQEGALRRLQEALKTEKAALAAAKEELAKEQAALRVAKARSTSRVSDACPVSIMCNRVM